MLATDATASLLDKLHYERVHKIVNFLRELCIFSPLYPYVDVYVAVRHMSESHGVNLLLLLLGE